MGRRAKFSVQQKLIIIKKTQTESIERLAQEYCVNAHTWTSMKNQVIWAFLLILILMIVIVANYCSK